MARKSNGNTTPRSKRTMAPESATVQPSPIQVGPDVDKNVMVAAVAASRPANLDEEIRRRAYELYLQRNGAAGDPNKDWFIAEREIWSRYAVQEHRSV